MLQSLPRPATMMSSSQTDSRTPTPPRAFRVIWRMTARNCRLPVIKYGDDVAQKGRERRYRKGHMYINPNPEHCPQLDVTPQAHQQIFFADKARKKLAP